MEGKEGNIDFELFNQEDYLIIEITDSGRGIERNKFKSIFEPGYTTKQRGWGLGLSLAKRIIEEYHHGKIFVKGSEIGLGTTFRIEIPTIQIENWELKIKNLVLLSVSISRANFCWKQKLRIEKEKK